ncbi:potassium channel family protein [Subtercola sp. YIM 133946]|uniref:potassium channel family protein n=1 Tax=Subtercola sp. YIM 133946 TaxID=3118909 RepID=UPI002F921796
MSIRSSRKTHTTAQPDSGIGLAQAEREADAAAITDRITDVLTEALPGTMADEEYREPPSGHAAHGRFFGFHRGEEGQAHWNSTVEWPLTVVSIVFLAVYSWDVIGNLKGAQQVTAEVIMWAVWGVFMINYIANLVLAPRRLRWFFTHILEFLIVALPMLRPLRLLRLVMLWTVLQRTAGTAFRGKVATYVIGSAGLLVIIAALGILDAEQNAPGADITNIGDALWWAFVTITTVGYGDYVPVTFEGRLIAVGLMIAGIALLGVITATLASWLVDRVRADSSSQTANVEHIDALSAQIVEMQAELVRSREAFADELAALRRTSKPSRQRAGVVISSRARRGAVSGLSRPRAVPRE